MAGISLARYVGVSTTSAEEPSVATVLVQWGHAEPERRGTAVVIILV
jgi:hypothetical protein